MNEELELTPKSNEPKPEPEAQPTIAQPQIDQGILKALEGASPTLIALTILLVVLGRSLFTFLNRREDLIHEREMRKLEKEKLND